MALAPVVGSVGIAHIHFPALRMALLEAVKSRQALSVASCSMLHHASATLHSTLQDIEAGGRYLVGVVRCRCPADSLAHQLLFRLHKADNKTLIHLNLLKLHKYTIIHQILFAHNIPI